MGNMFGMFMFAFWVIRTLKWEAGILLKFESAGIPVRPFEYLKCTHYNYSTCPLHAYIHAMSMPIVMSQGSHMI